jgi:DHA2 family methylenomycin A resistance protein-like MFS transporter
MAGGREPEIAVRPGWTLVAACLAQFMILLDTSIVNVALPSIQRDLDVATDNLVWIVNAYVLTFASFILLGGRLGDRFGRRRYFVVGFGVFTAFSAACALSTDEGQLIAFRALQGIGAALLAPLALSIIVDAFPAERRAFAIGVWAGVAGVGFAAGAVVGGLLLAVFDWPAVFWVNVPVGFAAIALTLAVVRESRDPSARRLDLEGAALASAGLVCLTSALTEVEDQGWISVFTISFLLAAAALLVGFVYHESRSPEPMLPLGVFRRSAFATANAMYSLLYASFGGMVFFVTLFLQNVWGYSPLETGLSFLFLSVTFLVVATFAGRIEGRLGAPTVVVAGCALATVGMLGLATLGEESPFAHVAASFVVISVGFGWAVPGLSTTAMTAVEPEHAGVASGVLNSARQVGSAVGLALLASVNALVATRAWENFADTLPAATRTEALSLTTDVLGGQGEEVGAAVPGTTADAFDAFLSGYRAALLVASGLTATAAILAVRAARARGRDPR